MSKTLIWVLVGVLAIAGVAAVALMGFHPQTAVAAAAQTAGDTKGASIPATTAPVAAAAAGSPASGETSGGQSTTVAAAEPVPAAPALSATPTVDDLIQNAAAYEGQPVVLRGTILTQCTAGCEFALDDGTGALSVQLEGSGKDRLIPLNKVGKKIEVHGVFHASPRPQVVIDDPNGWQFVK